MKFNSLKDKIVAKYQQLDSGKFWTVSSPAFNAKAMELVSLFACMSPTLSQVEPANAYITS